MPQQLLITPPKPRDVFTERQQCQVAQLFQDSKIPYVYFLAPSLAARSPDYNASSWVVPDRYFGRAVRTLQRAEFPKCVLKRECALRSLECLRPLPDYHFHSNKYPTVEQFEYGHPICTSIDLYRKSTLLWMFPDPPIDIVTPHDSCYEARGLTKPGLRSYLPLADKLPVTVLTFPKFIEAFIMLACRDCEGHWSFKFWIDFLLFIRRYEEGARQRDPALADDADKAYPLWRMEMIGEPYRDYYKRLVYYDYDQRWDNDCGTQTLRFLQMTLRDVIDLPKGDGRLLWCCWGKPLPQHKDHSRPAWRNVRCLGEGRPELDLQRLGTQHRCVHKLAPAHPRPYHERPTAFALPSPSTSPAPSEPTYPESDLSDSEPHDSYWM
ncbi:uncharacterized protein BO97DRAFT_58314 [Aspergillus homomorphus CBS 101889]|uniref:Uncharacterized protein n=1 Tax=Aspergillus homomorphus (strain CBS 101889) TaxID=1450537 RepID=A0A395HYN6_ASPHC|nr:hypothetical protein BO97DRAFT_58314 [Aspergillus homomorphus CBS 101889]RAL12503.1 hypothetical protein BO97DRAFT_58314 [Aspergillus homomorphus CBS 101889]